MISHKKTAMGKTKAGKMLLALGANAALLQGPGCHQKGTLVTWHLTPGLPSSSRAEGSRATLALPGSLAAVDDTHGG